MSLTYQQLGGLFCSKTDEWATPQHVFDELDAEFHFTCDVCALPENAKCAEYLTPLQDSLCQFWHGICWMNPPYGREIADWIQKAWEESCRGCTVVCLVPSRTDTRWFHDYVLGKAEIRFIKGRLRFGDAVNAAPFPSMVVIYRPQIA